MAEMLALAGDCYSWDRERVKAGADKLQALGAAQMAEGELLKLMGARRGGNDAGA